MKNKIFVAVVAIIAIVGFFLLKNKSSQLSPIAGTPGASLVENFIRPHSPSTGNSLGRVTIVEWFDPECESCRAIHPTIKQIISEYKDRAHFVLRYMPYHQNSMFAATALEEAKELGKFDEALDILFEKQPEWADHHQPRPELIITFLGKLGIAKEKLERDYLLKKHGEKIRLDEADGKKVGVRGTPTFFINGQMLRELGEEPLRDAIEANLK